MNLLRKIVAIAGIAGTSAAATGVGMGMESSGNSIWQIVLSVIGIVGAGGIGTLGAAKLAQLRILVKETSEALVAIGLAGIAVANAYEDGKRSAEEKADIISKAKAIGVECKDVCIAATALITKK